MKTDRIHEAEYIKTSDGHIGVVVGGTQHFIDTVVEFGKFTLNLRFSLNSYRQVGTPTRSFSWHKVGEGY